MEAEEETAIIDEQQCLWHFTFTITIAVAAAAAYKLIKLFVVHSQPS